MNILPQAAKDFALHGGKHALQALVVDDEPLVRWAVTETLRAAGYDVREAGDADSVVHSLADCTSAPDLVLLDLRLPDCGDLSLLGIVRLLAPSATIILMTAFGTPEIRTQALRLGAAHVLDKPFDVDGLSDMIAALRRPA